MSEPKSREVEMEPGSHAVVVAMLEYVAPFMTPISEVIDHDYGQAWGTGSYVSLDSRRFLLTNEHVARKIKQRSIAHKFHESEDVFRCLNPMIAIGAPEDVALSLIEDAVWDMRPHRGAPIAHDRYATKHAPVDGELLFMAGYSGERSYFSFERLVSPATSYLTREVEVPTEYGNPQFHFALPYYPDLATSVEERAYGLPEPHGFSGSLVWNTRFVELSNRGEFWKAEEARVTGLLWGWPSGTGCLIATRVEHLELPFLAQMAITEAGKLSRPKE